MSQNNPKSEIPPKARRQRHASERNRKSKIPWLVVTAILLIAAFFRFYRLADLPLGLFADPSINGLDAIRLIQRGGPVIFFPTNGGREPLIVFLLTVYLRLFGTTPFAIRSLAATGSLLTVAFLIAFLRMVCTTHHALRPTPYRRCLPLLAGLILAVSPWSIAVDRLGLRPTLAPLVAVPLFWFLLKGWATGQKRWFILSGLLMGLEGYTYSAARLLPVILLLAVLPEFFFNLKSQNSGGQSVLWPPDRWSHLKIFGSHLILFGLTALIIYLPLAWYLLTHPAQFTARAGSVMVWNFLATPGEVAAELGRNTLRVVGFFCCTGSPNPLFGLLDSAGLPWLLAPFLLIGLIVCLKNWRDLFSRLVALWWLIGLTPSIITIEAPHPLRMIMAIPPTAILVALGLASTGQWLENQALFRLSKRTNPTSSHTPLLFSLACLLILLPTPFFFRAYFIRWPELPVTQGVYNYGAIAIRDLILDQPNDKFPIYLPVSRFNEATLLYYLSERFPRQAELTVPPAERAWLIASATQRDETVWLRLDPGRATLLPPLTPAGQALIRAALTEATGQPIRTGRGETVARLVELPGDPAQFLQSPSRDTQADFGPARLTGLAYPPEIDPAGGPLPVTLFWQALAPMRTEYQVILQLVDDQRQVWGDGSGRPNDWVYPTSFWRPGLDQIASYHEVSWGHDPLPPGRYQLAVSLYDPTLDRRLPLTEAKGEAPDTFFVGPLKMALPPPDQAQLEALKGERAMLAQPVRFGEAIRLLEAGLISRSESKIDLTLLWEATARPEQDYTVFIHLLDAADNLVAGSDTQPLAGRYPTSIWARGEQILDPHQLSLPAALPPGSYHLALGLYYQPSGERLPLVAADGLPQPEGRLLLTQPLIIPGP